jgi:hypothetical protein
VQPSKPTAPLKRPVRRPEEADGNLPSPPSPRAKPRLEKTRRDPLPLDGHDRLSAAGICSVTRSESWLSTRGVRPAGVDELASRSSRRSTATWLPSTAARSSSVSAISSRIRWMPSLALGNCASLEGWGT